MRTQDQIEAYLDGFKAAMEIADSVKLRVAPEVDVAIALGVSAVGSTLRSQHKRFLEILQS